MHINWEHDVIIIIQFPMFCNYFSKLKEKKRKQMKGNNTWRSHFKFRVQDWKYIINKSNNYLPRT